MPMHHVNLKPDQSELLKRLCAKLGLQQSGVVGLALRALELQEAHRDREVKGS
jgi:hypothetical protein